MAKRTLKIVNRSTHKPRTVEPAIEAMSEAIAVQLRHLAAAWGQVVWEIVDDANAIGFEIALFDDDVEQADAVRLALRDRRGHSVRARLPRPDTRSRRPVAPHLALGVRHRVARGVRTHRRSRRESVGADGPRRARMRWSCATRSSPTPTTSACAMGRRVSVSDFLYPDWFNPFAPDRFGVRPHAYLDQAVRSRTRRIRDADERRSCAQQVRARVSGLASANQALMGFPHARPPHLWRRLSDLADLRKVPRHCGS